MKDDIATYLFHLWRFAINSQYRNLYSAVKRHTSHVCHIGKGLVSGTIKGYRFRLFQELNMGENGTNGTKDKYGAYLCINDEASIGTDWSAFYNGCDVDEWANNKTTY